MNIRKLIRKIHLWVGLPSGLILAVVGVTGSLLIFEPEVISWLNAEQLLPEKTDSIFETDQELARYIEGETKGTIHSLQWPLRERQIYKFKLMEDDLWYMLDHTTGKIFTEQNLKGVDFFKFIVDLHRTLTIGETGRWITATTSLLMALVLITTGLYLWWPKNWKILKTLRGFKSRFAIKTSGSKKRLNYDLHNVSGFYTSIPLFIMAITGAFFLYDKEIQSVIDTITFSEQRQDADWKGKLRTKAPVGEEALNVYEVLDKMDELYPQYLRRNLWMYGEDIGYINLAFQNNNTVSAGAQLRIFVSLDRYSGEILRDTNPNNLPLGSQLTELWVQPLHFGEFGGMITRIIWFLGGLMPTLLLITGSIIWKNRGKNPRNIRLKAFLSIETLKKIKKA